MTIRQMPNPQEMPRPIPPRCPHCKCELAEVAFFSWMAPPFMILATYCPGPDCHVLLHQHITPMQQADASTEEPPAPPRIMVPS